VKTHPYDLVARLLEYPDGVTPQVALRAEGDLARRSPEAAAELEAFRTGVAGLDPREVEELYTRTFDILAPCCLDVGYQLFGETYKRGSFLVKMRGAARRYGVEPGSELPDHLPVVLRILARVDAGDDPSELAVEVLLPAVEKMLRSLAAGENPYAAVLRAVRALLCADFGVAPARIVERSLPVLEEPALGGDHA
jgi:nitrate reductase delta subunit